MRNLILIAAIGENNELGKNNDLIWKIKGDLKFFKEKTTNHHIVMGRNTFFSLPGILPNRKHIVLTDVDEKYQDEVIVCRSLEEFFKYANDVDDDIYVVGGASIYNLFINYCDMMYLTTIEDSCKDADVYFPRFKDEEWTKEVLEEHPENTPKYKHVLYKKKEAL